MNTKRAEKKSNYDHFDYVCLFETKDKDDRDITVKVRKYQSSLEFNKSQDALIEVWQDTDGGEMRMMILIDDGNGIDVPISNRIDYSQWVYLTCALRAYDVQYSYARDMKVIKVT